ncbi:restriction endonuclease subunit S [Prevotella sp. MGM2]|jgi:type I restriction enzyme S subunit|uniref:restriction endonuclease subunit S n=1 Tax=Bacteroidales TaxID=171549 RepID=UPI000CEA4A0E|nr:restriction endonuclease subunit S [Prevotella sp. MGM2]GAY31574.1 restriction endonuclease subunit S [Prevotella sp. MGM2]
MEQWKEYQLKDVTTILGDGLHGTPEYDENGTVFFINGNNLVDGKIEIKDSTKRVSEEEANKYRKNLTQRTIFVSINGTIGNVAKYKGEACILGKSACYFNVAENFDLNFIYYVVASQQFKDAITRLATGTTIKNVSLETMRNYSFMAPSINEQKRISSILSSLDSKIELNRRINDNLEQQAQALFKAWFVEFEPFGGTMPSNWEICEAQKYFNINIGKTPPRNEMRWFSQKSTDCKWASISDLGKCGLFINDTSEYLTKDAVETFNIIVVPKGTILLSFKLTLGRVSITTCPLTTNEAIARFLINHDYEREYLYLLLKQFDYTSLGNTSSIATAVNSKIIRSMPIMMPTVDVLQRFHHIVSPIFTRMRFLSDEIMQLTDTRNTVLPQLMSGGLKINNLNC